MIEITNIRKAKLNEDTHVYSDDNGIAARFSVSAIAQRGVTLPDKKHIRAAAAVGTRIHEILHKIIQTSINEEGGINFEQCQNRAKSTVLSPEESAICCHFIDMLMGFGFKNPKVTSEQSLIADFNGVPIGGTADLIVVDGDDTYIIDFKTAKMGGFKKEYHLQLYGYSLFQQGATRFKCYVLHPEGVRPLFDSPIPAWIPSEFEENFNYMLSKEKPKPKLKFTQTAVNNIKMIADTAEEFRIAKAELNARIRQIEKQEKECMDLMYQCMGELFEAFNEFETSDGRISYQKVTNRRHTITYRPELEKYYDCSVSEEYHLTIDGQKVKLKVNVKGDENE